MHRGTVRFAVSLLFVVGLVGSMAEMTRCELVPFADEHAAIMQSGGAEGSAPAVPTHAGPLDCCHCVHTFTPMVPYATAAVAVPRGSRPSELVDQLTSVTPQPPVRPPSA